VRHGSDRGCPEADLPTRASRRASHPLHGALPDQVPRAEWAADAQRHHISEVTMRVAVLMGGTSAERDVSLASGLRMAQALRERGHEVVAIDTARGALSAADEQALKGERVVKTIPPDVQTLARLDRALPAQLGEIRNADVIML